MKTIEVGTAVSRVVGKSTGFLDVGTLPDGRPMRSPVIILQGAADGPTLWLHGCVHGNEYCGTFIIHEVLRGLALGDLKGAVVALPALNVTAFEKNSAHESFRGLQCRRSQSEFPRQGGWISDSTDGSCDLPAAQEICRLSDRFSYRHDAGRAAGRSTPTSPEKSARRVTALRGPSGIEARCRLRPTFCPAPP